MSISIPFEELVASASGGQNNKFDCLIIGSGYGGAIAARTFSRHKKANGEKLKIAVLERGKEYSPGSFPAGLNEAIKSFNSPGGIGSSNSSDENSWSSPHDGLYDIRTSETHWILAGNGVGGGSLINAGVMLAPDSTTLNDTAWPQEARSILNDIDYMNDVGLMLGSRLPNGESGSIANTVTYAEVETNKYRSITSLGGSICTVTPTPLSIRLTQDEPDQAIKTSPCIKCGNCFSGCNFNAKKSLDTNLLAEAQYNGVTVVNGAETLFFEKHCNGWAVHVVYSSAKLRTTLTEPLELHCDHLVISAGSIGSTELLLRSQYKARCNSAGVSLFSEMLGKRFYGNGDTISTIIGRSEPVTMIASDSTQDDKREIGPTNSGMLDFRIEPKQQLISQVLAILRALVCRIFEFIPFSGKLGFCSKSNNRFLLQELAVPGVLQRVLIELVSFTHVRNSLTSLRCGIAGSSAKFLGLSEANIDNTIVIAGIGGDRSEGIISEKVKEKIDGQISAANYSGWLPNADISFSDDAADISWKKHREKVLGKLEELSGNDIGSAVIENPMENLLGDQISKLFGMSLNKSSDTKGKLLSVHPLGGCVMADTVEKGVVNAHGQVFKSVANKFEANKETLSKNTEVYDNLAVVDGSIVPAPADVNPALTIAALALNASENLAKKWGWEPATVPMPKPVKREFFRHIRPEHREYIKPTELTLAERLVGTVCLDLGDGPEPCIAELRLRSEPFSVDQFVKSEPLTIELLHESSPDCAVKLPKMSTLRLFRKTEWDSLLVASSVLERRKNMIDERKKDQWIEEQRLFFEETDAELEKRSLLTVPLSGTISIMEEVETTVLQRLHRSVPAWLTNRALRDFFHSLQIKKSDVSALRKATGFVQSIPGFVNKIIHLPSVLLHSGRERRLHYQLKTGVPVKSSCEKTGVDPLLWTDQPVVGQKRFFYDKHSNPINQLLSIELSEFPQMLDNAKSNTLSVDLEYFADVQVPLFQIHKESDAVTGYADLAALAAWFARISLLHYFWILRKPDTPSEFPEHRRPARRNTEPISLPGLDRKVEVIYLKVADPKKKNEGDTFIRLSRFRDGEPDHTLDPVLCIHGFSLSWSMYAHETLYGGIDGNGAVLKGGLAAYLARKGHDVWVIDLRSSGSLPTAQVDWEFEEAALIDIPVALKYISKRTKKPKINVVSHCMGAMKLSMLMMCSEENFRRYNQAQDNCAEGNSAEDNSAIYLTETRNRIGRIVLSQAGPYVRFSPANRLRERIISVVKNLANFDLQFEENPDASEKEEVMDRVLNAMPYPKHEIRTENPKWGTRFWVRGRHRMDALYGKTFSLKNMDMNVLERFHDFFGPLSFRMLEQVIWFSRRNQISNKYGEDYKWSYTNLKQVWKQDTLWIHGKENQLLDPISTVLTTLEFDESGADNFRAEILENFGHQDCIMGKDCELPYSLINDHFSNPDSVVIT